jgi:class 3 adenylate cyclase/tetratricopeptide (TPR) repeat protein
LLCPSCQHENRPTAAFCEECGTRFERLCASCGNALRPTARFCDACGTSAPSLTQDASPEEPASAQETSRDPRNYTPKHLAERILTSKSALEGERKHVTVLFADVAGYTSLSERSDPEQMHSIMDRCFQIILREVHRFEGTINQFTGDGVMALFGAPLALEDAPRRAVSAALAIQRALGPFAETIRQRHDSEFRMRIGINTGQVVVGSIGDDLRMDYTAIGDTTNLAARLEQRALPGTILISEVTHNLVSGYFDSEDLGEVGIKGKSSSVRAFRVSGERAVSGRIEAAGSAGLTPLVGRDRELDAIGRAFESASEGRGQVAFLVGDAGIGKSRLLHEFRERLSGEPHVWFEGRCAAYGESSAYLAIADAFRRHFGIDDRNDDATALSKIDTSLESLSADLEWTRPFVRLLLSLPPGDETVASMEAQLRRSETVRAIQAILLALAQDKPLVLVIEDLHWIDAASEEFVGVLAESIPAARALFILTHRPGYQHPFGDRSYHVRLALQPLSYAEVSDLASRLLLATDLPESLHALIADKSDGNPFFIEEVTKSLLDEGVLALHDGRVELAGDLQDISVPDSIHDILMARIDRLDEGPKRAIQVASVIGREFALRLLERIAEAGQQISSVVGELRSLELIYEKASHPELAFMFKHALTHDVAYESVLVQRRTALHRIVGSAIEELYPDRLAEHYEALAHHFSQGNDWDRALRYHILAAEKAADGFANRAATQHYQDALEICEKMDAPAEDRRRIHDRLARLYYSTSELGLAAEAHLASADLDDDAPRAALNVALAASNLFWAHEYTRAREINVRARATARELDDDAALAVSLQIEALDRDVHGHFDREVFEEGWRASDLAEASGNPEAMTWACSYHAIACKHVGDFQRGIDVSERALAAARRHGMNPPMPVWTLGLSLGSIGRYQDTITLFSEAIAITHRIGQNVLEARLLNSLGWTLGEIGCHEQARHPNLGCSELGSVMVEAGQVAGADELYANGKINLACNLLMLGATDSAEEELGPVEAELASDGDPWMRWRYAMHLIDAKARIALARGDIEQTLALTRDEIAAALPRDSVKCEARAYELHGRALLHGDQRIEAEEALRKALEIARTIQHPPVVWRSLSLLGEIARRAGADSEGQRLTRQARDLVEQLAAPIASEELKRNFLALGERLETDPLGAHR